MVENQSKTNKNQRVKKERVRIYSPFLGAGLRMVNFKEQWLQSWPFVSHSAHTVTGVTGPRELLLTVETGRLLY